MLARTKSGKVKNKEKKEEKWTTRGGGWKRCFVILGIIFFAAHFKKVSKRRKGAARFEESRLSFPFSGQSFVQLSASSALINYLLCRRKIIQEKSEKKTGNGHKKHDTRTREKISKKLLCKWRCENVRVKPSERALNFVTVQYRKTIALAMLITARLSVWQCRAASACHQTKVKRKGRRSRGWTVSGRERASSKRFSFYRYTTRYERERTTRTQPYYEY